MLHAPKMGPLPLPGIVVLQSIKGPPPTRLVDYLQVGRINRILPLSSLLVRTPWGVAV